MAGRLSMDGWPPPAARPVGETGGGEPNRIADKILDRILDMMLYMVLDRAVRQSLKSFSSLCEFWLRIAAIFKMNCHLELQCGLRTSK